MADTNKTEPAIVKTVWTVSMVVGPHPGVYIVASSAKEAEDEYRKRFHLADGVELWCGKVPG